MSVLLLSQYVTNIENTYYLSSNFFWNISKHENKDVITA